ncbi:MAG: amidohydrolase family protein [Melioribacteraceae bacterium]|nr:amidohydrolase family protein [Melioribacteraceae bacterium]
MKRLLKYVLAVLITASSFNAQIKIFKNAEILTASGKNYSKGILVINNSKIEFVGQLEDYNIPSDAEIVDVEGKVIIPGLVDTHSHIGIDWGFDSDSPTQPDLRILDAIDPFHSTFNRARAGGITTVNIMPGSGHLMSGQTVYLKTKRASTLEEMLICENVQFGICGGMKMANGTNSLRGKPFPGTRAKSAAIIRDLFYQAKEYKKKMDEADSDAAKMPERNIKLEPLVEILEGKRMVHHHTHRADDIMTVLRLKEEFGFKVVLHHVSEGWKVAEEIAKADVPCSIIVVDSPGGKIEAVGLKFETGKILDDAGVDVAIHTDDWITDSRFFLRSAALAMRAGLSKEKALESLTIAGARMLEMDDKVGSLEKGKDADFLILSGDPFSVYTHIESTWIEGEKVFARNNPEDYKYAVGGYKAYPRFHHVHGEEEIR